MHSSAPWALTTVLHNTWMGIPCFWSEIWAAFSSASVVEEEMVDCLLLRAASGEKEFFPFKQQKEPEVENLSLLPAQSASE